MICDPEYNHVGIDISPLSSVVTERWSSNISIMEGMQHNATIIYNPTSYLLSVNFSGFRDDGSYILQSLSYVVDLRMMLPELMYFGFSGSSGEHTASHTINSWSFSSSFHNLYQYNSTRSGPINQVPASENSSPRKNRIVVGLASLGATALLMFLGLTKYFVRKKNKRTLTEVDNTFDALFSDEFERGSGPRKFSYDNLARATSNFAEKEKLGQGGFGGVYKGSLRKQTHVLQSKGGSN